MTAWQLLKAYGEQVFIAFDQLANALIPPIDQGVFATVTALTVGGYITGNVVQKATAKDAAP